MQESTKKILKPSFTIQDLKVVDNKTDKTTPFNLNPEGSRVEVKKSGDVIYILEREADSLLE